MFELYWISIWNPKFGFASWISLENEIRFVRCSPSKTEITSRLQARAVRICLLLFALWILQISLRITSDSQNLDEVDDRKENSERPNLIVADLPDCAQTQISSTSHLVRFIGERRATPSELYAFNAYFPIESLFRGVFCQVFASWSTICGAYFQFRTSAISSFQF